MHKSAVGYAIGKLMQIMGLFLLASLAIAAYDNFTSSLSKLVGNPEVLGF